jgi:AcrR family transcriptional regulator
MKPDADRPQEATPAGDAAEPRSGRRPAVRDAEATKQRILRASRAEFARHGYSGARVDRIARVARANKRMLYYHVGNKDALYLEALEAAYADIRAAEQELRLEEMEPLAAIERLVRFTWEYFLANPEFIALLNTENLHQARHIKRSRHIGSMNSPVVATVGRILDEGVGRGLIRRGIDPLQLYISIASLCYFYLSNLHTLTVVFDADLKEQRALDARVAHVVDLVLNGLRRK